jgi:hypothetical protein
VTRRAQQSGSSRTTAYTHAQRVVQAVTSAQAGGISYDALWHENERLKAENEALWQAWSEAEATAALPIQILTATLNIAASLSLTSTWCLVIDASKAHCPHAHQIVNHNSSQKMMF